MTTVMRFMCDAFYLYAWSDLVSDAESDESEVCNANAGMDRVTLRDGLPISSWHSSS